MSIVIFGDLFNFPEGQAATNRVYTYAKGFIENGVNVHVICFYSDYNDNGTGVVGNIKFYHAFCEKRRSNYFIIRRWHKLKKFYRTFSLIRKINRKDKIVAINSWSDLLTTNVFASLLSMLFKAKLIIECSEHPFRFFQGTPLKRMVGQLKLLIETRLADGLFCISTFLIDFYKAKGIDKHKLLLVPSTVDPGRFTNTTSKPVDYKYIGYFGSLTFIRDNVDLLINSFAKLSPAHAEIHLVLGGFCSAADKNQIQALITDLNIQSKVLLLNFLPRDEVVRYISHAEILVMVRRNNMQSQASYPSKLTEYLTSGKPVVTVDVGEVSDYLTDGENAFLIKPGSVEELRQKLDYILNDYASAMKVGQAGRELTYNIFNYNYQAKRMIDFINSLSRN